MCVYTMGVYVHVYLCVHICNAIYLCVHICNPKHYIYLCVHTIYIYVCTFVMLVFRVWASLDEKDGRRESMWYGDIYLCMTIDTCVCMYTMYSY